MKIKNFINELEKIHNIYPESNVWIEDDQEGFTENFDLRILITDSEVEVTVKMRN